MEECISKETVISKPDHKAAHDTFVLQYSVKSGSSDHLSAHSI